MKKNKKCNETGISIYSMTGRYSNGEPYKVQGRMSSAPYKQSKIEGDMNE
jgi:hypothetical protein